MHYIFTEILFFELFHAIRWLTYFNPSAIRLKYVWFDHTHVTLVLWTHVDPVVGLRLTIK